jgi:deoxyribodipyrimidine photo-lyase
MQQAEVNIVWLKRDLRIQDHAAFYEAAKNGPLLPIFTWDANCPR